MYKHRLFANTMPFYVTPVFEHPQIMVICEEEEGSGPIPQGYQRQLYKEVFLLRSLNRMTLNKPILIKVCSKWVLTPYK